MKKSLSQSGSLHSSLGIKNTDISDELHGEVCPFGADWSSGATRLPSVVQHVVDAVEDNGFDPKSISQPYTSASKISELKKAYSEGSIASSSELFALAGDTSVLLALLKTWFTELPNPLFTFDLYEPLIKSYSFADRLQRMQALVKSLSPANLSLLKYIFNFLVKLSLKTDVAGLAQYFGPSMLRPPHNATSVNENDGKLVMNVMTTCIERHKEIFESEEKDSRYDGIFQMNVVPPPGGKTTGDESRRPPAANRPPRSPASGNRIGSVSAEQREKIKELIRHTVGSIMFGAEKVSDTYELVPFNVVASPRAQRRSIDVDSLRLPALKSPEASPETERASFSPTTPPLSPSSTRGFGSPRASPKHISSVSPGNSFSGGSGAGSPIGSPRRGVPSLLSSPRSTIPSTSPRFALRSPRLADDHMPSKLGVPELIERNRTPSPALEPMDTEKTQQKDEPTSHTFTFATSPMKPEPILGARHNSMFGRLSLSMVSEEPENPLLLALKRLDKERLDTKRPADLALMDNNQLEIEKASIKRELRDFDTTFKKRVGHMPRKQDKELMRPLYQRYRDVKSQLDSNTSTGSNAPTSTTPTSPLTQHAPLQIPSNSNTSTNSPTSQNAIYQYPAPILPSSTHSPSRLSPTTSNLSFRSFSESSIATPSSPTLNRKRSSDLEDTEDKPEKYSKDDTGLPNEDQFNNNDPKLVLLRSLKAEKKRLQLLLHQYQSDFIQKTGRKLQFGEDRAPVMAEYERYKSLKAEIAELENRLFPKRNPS